MAEARVSIDPSLDEVVWSEVEAKGCLPTKLGDGQREVVVVFYDPTRLGQDVEAETASGGTFVSPPIVVLPSVTRAAVEAAADALASSGFTSVSRW